MELEPEASMADGDELRRELRALSARVVAVEEQLILLRLQALPGGSAGGIAPEQERVNAGSPPPPLIAPGIALGADGAGARERADATSTTVPARFHRKQTTRGSIEDRIGAQIFNRVGVLALLLGAAWGLKLAIANGLIGPVGRVLIGLLAGAGIVWWSERFRRGGFAAFSYSLKALGSSLLYLTLWAAFHLYGLLPAPIALVVMLLVTAWNGYMAWAQDAELLAAYAFAGALATPALLSTGGNHEVFLFTYLLAIDVACAALIKLKRWTRLLLGVFPATMTFFVGWYSRFYAPGELVVTSLFIVLLYAAFLLAVFETRLIRGASLPGSDAEGSVRHSITEVLLPIADAGFLALALYSVFEDSGHHALESWLMVLLAALYLGLMRLPQRPVTAGVHLSLAVVFLTVAIPLALNDSWITIAWFVEGSALLAVAYQQAGLEVAPQGRLLRILGVSALLLGLLAAIWRILSATGGPYVAFLSPTFGVALVGLLCLAVAAALSLRAMERNASARRPTPREIAGGSVIAFNLLALIAIIEEIESLWRTQPHGVVDPDLGLKRGLAISAFLMLYGAALLAAGFWRRSSFVRWQGLLLVIVTIAKTFLWDLRDLSQGYRIASFLGLGALLMAISFAYQRDWLGLRQETPSAQTPTGPAT